MDRVVNDCGGCDQRTVQLSTAAHTYYYECRHKHRWRVWQCLRSERGGSRVLRALADVGWARLLSVSQIGVRDRQGHMCANSVHAAPPRPAAGGTSPRRGCCCDGCSASRRAAAGAVVFLCRRAAKNRPVVAATASGRAFCCVAEWPHPGKARPERQERGRAACDAGRRAPPHSHPSRHRQMQAPRGDNFAEFCCVSRPSNSLHPPNNTASANHHPAVRELTAQRCIASRLPAASPPTCSLRGRSRRYASRLLGLGPLVANARPRSTVASGLLALEFPPGLCRALGLGRAVGRSPSVPPRLQTAQTYQRLNSSAADGQSPPSVRPSARGINVSSKSKPVGSTAWTRRRPAHLWEAMPRFAGLRSREV